jgi:hypothetical protein
MGLNDKLDAFNRALEPIADALEFVKNGINEVKDRLDVVTGYFNNVASAVQKVVTYDLWGWFKAQFARIGISI